MKERLKILDIWVDPVDRREAIKRVQGFLSGRKPCCIFAANPEKNFSVPKDPDLYEVFKHADLLIPDGIGIVLAARLLHGAKLNRVPGVDLMKDICRLAERTSKFFSMAPGKLSISLQFPGFGLNFPGCELPVVVTGMFPNRKCLNLSGASTIQARQFSFYPWALQSRKNGLLPMPLS